METTRENLTAIIQKNMVNQNILIAKDIKTWKESMTRKIISIKLSKSGNKLSLFWGFSVKVKAVVPPPG